ncbi:acyltransferase [Haoranjiania flava]|uniref:acyltransferase n=1 Tax=Haoranjiania flava TaxID=1856322 RepID=UPI00295006D5|nr:acyltransferase [Haoranjiania flava]
MTIKERIKNNPALKKAALFLLMSKGDPRPRWWIRNLVNPFKRKMGRGSRIRCNARVDVFPYNDFYMGERSIVEDFTVINNGVGEVLIGDNTIIGIGNVIIGPVEIGNNVMLAQHIVVSALNHNYRNVDISPKEQGVDCKRVIIADNVWIGANSVITPGVSIGKHAVIGAGSVVTKNVPAYSVVVGNPATVIKIYNPETNEWEKVIA